MNGIEAKRDGVYVVIIVRAGDKTARLRVTPEYAAAFASTLIDVAGGAPRGGHPLDFLESLLNGGRDA